MIVCSLKNAFISCYSSYEELKERVLWALKKVEMLEYAEGETKELSFGEKKKIAIVTVLAMEQEVVVFDEPSANLDFKARDWGGSSS